MVRARDTAAEGEGASSHPASLAAVDARLAALRHGGSPLSAAVDAVLSTRTDRRPTRVVLETVARRAARQSPGSVLAAATAVDLLDARTAVRWTGLPGREPGSTAAILVGDYLHSLAFEALVSTESGVSGTLVDAVTRGVSDLYGEEVAADLDERVPRTVRRAVFGLADGVVEALGASGPDARSR